MMLEKTLQRVKSEIIDEFKNIIPVDMPGIALIVNKESESAINYINIIKNDCEDVRFNWFLTNIDSATDEDFLRRVIDDYTDMDDVTIILVLLPLPDTFKNIKDDLFDMRQDTKYEKLNIIELVNNAPSIGSRITVLGITKELYITSKG